MGEASVRQVLDALKELRRSTDARLSSIERNISANSSNKLLGDQFNEGRRSKLGSNVSSPFLSPDLSSTEDSELRAALRDYQRRNRLVRINVGGQIYEMRWRTVVRMPHTRLGRLGCVRRRDELLRVCDDYDLSNNEFRFDRHSRNFGCVANFCSSGKLHMGEDTCAIAFSQDMEYWGISELHMEACCVQRFYQQKELLNWDYVLERKRREQIEKEEKEEQMAEIRDVDVWERVRKELWALFEKPNSSFPAKVVAFISVFFILLATVVMTLDTLPYFMYEHLGHNISNVSNSIDYIHRGSSYQPFVIMEAIYMGWFTIEYIVRFFASPDKWCFLKGLLNMVDLLAILPYYISLGLRHWKRIGELHEARRIAQFFRILRILRIFKLAKHSVGLQSLGYTLRNSSQELGLLMLFLTLFVLMFSTLAFVFEHDDPNSKFRTLLDAYWWALITMTTVGFGDVAPVTLFGRLVGSMCAICGVLVIALPIPIIGNNFAAFYKNEKRRLRLREQKLRVGLMRGPVMLAPHLDARLPFFDSDEEPEEAIRHYLRQKIDIIANEELNDNDDDDKSMASNVTSITSVSRRKPRSSRPLRTRSSDANALNEDNLNNEVDNHNEGFNDNNEDKKEMEVSNDNKDKNETIFASKLYFDPKTH